MYHCKTNTNGFKLLIFNDLVEIVNSFNCPVTDHLMRLFIRDTFTVWGGLFVSEIQRSHTQVIANV